MSDPPKKLGSLKDRIAAFENKATTGVPASAPVPRPKPAGAATWKPKPPSPPQSPPRSTGDGTSEAKAGMSAVDARESIGRGSLKDRMAALQGRGGFGVPGGPPPPIAPKPAVERPKWKPPPVVAAPIDDDDDDELKAPKSDVASPPAAAESHEVHPAREEPEEEASAPVGRAAEEEGGEKEADPEEEERQRRAAIAARIARLGGTRVGMAPPPIIGKKPEIKRAESTKAKEEEPPKPSPPPVVETKDSPKPEERDVSPEAAGAEETEPLTKLAQSSQESLPPTSAPPTPLISPDSSSGSKPTSMPVPAGPRRAAPPRKKPAAKSPSPAAPEPALDDGVTQSPASTPLLGESVPTQEAAEAAQQSEAIEEAGTREPELGGPEQAEALVAALEPASEEALDKPEESEAAEVPLLDTPSPAPVIHAAEPSHEPEDADGDDSESINKDEPKVEEQVPVEEEEDEVARRQRIAERIAKSGGFNPFSGLPPTKKPSLPPAPQTDEPGELPEEASHSISPPLPARRESFRKPSTGSVVSESFATKPASIRQASIDSVHAETPRSPPPLPTSPKPEVPARRDSTASVGSNASARISQDDRKPILHQSVHHHEPSISEDAFEEATGESKGDQGDVPAYGEPEPVGNSTTRRDSAISVHDRPVSSLELPEEEEVAEPEEQYEEEYEQPISERSASPQSEYAEEESEQLVESEPEPEPVPPPRPPIPPTKRTSIPPPPRASIPPPPEVEPDVEVPRRTSVSRRSIPPPPVEADEGPAVPEAPPAAQYAFRNIPPPPPIPLKAREVELESEEDPTTKGASAIPPPVLPKDEVPYEEVSQGIENKPPPLPAFKNRPIPVPIDTPPEPGTPLSPSIPQPPPRVPLPHGISIATSTALQTFAPQKLSASDELEDQPEGELLSDDDVDPIDPAFHSPAKTSPTVPPAPPPSAVSPTPPTRLPQILAVPIPEQEEPEENEEQTKRRTIAERMAKLGGIRLGAPMPIPPRAIPPPARSEEVPEANEVEGDNEGEEPTEEEDEFARKQRIAARIAGMGGVRIGLVPSVTSPPPVTPPPPRAPPRREDSETYRAPPVIPKIPPPPPPPQPQLEAADDSEDELLERSIIDEGVHLSTEEESEIEEVSHEEAQEEAPPPVPSRTGRPTPGSGAPQRPPPMPGSFSRPPVPVGRPPVPPTSSFRQPPSRQATITAEEPLHSPPAIVSSASHDFVMVEPESMDEPPPPPPPARPSRAPPPPRSALPPPPPPVETDNLAASTWELPQIPSASLHMGGESDLSLSDQWSDVPSQVTSSDHPPPLPPHDEPSLEPRRRTADSAELNLSADDLMGQWGRVGVQIHEVAATLFDKSKKTVVGDGSYHGFVVAVLSQVPIAAPPPSTTNESYGYLIYSQVGSTVQRRASDIMPGDIMWLHDVKLKGHKGLQIYHQTVGADEPLVGIVADFEAKKPKVKVFQANHHVGQQSVETVSYRLEDVKSGTIKVFRALEQ